jgi:hypothetical protein
MTNDIYKRSTVTRGVDSGELLEMSDGSKWFHPFDGSKPNCESPANPERAQQIIVKRNMARQGDEMAAIAASGMPLTGTARNLARYLERNR